MSTSPTSSSRSTCAGLGLGHRHERAARGRPIGDLTNATTAPGSLSLLVIYTEQLEACRDFYAGLGLYPAREQHGTGPVHYSIEFGAGTVLELYPGKPDQNTGRVRLGVTVTASSEVPTGRELRTDPDGRVVDLRVEWGGPLSERAITEESTLEVTAQINRQRAARGEPPLGETSREVRRRRERALERARLAGMA